MAAYKAAETTPAAVRSVLAQTHVDWELIIASDCGTDYLALCHAKGIRDGRIRMVATPSIGAGPSAARNAALATAQGDYLANLDSDDIWLPKKLSALLPLAMESGLACDNTCAVRPDGTVVTTAHPVGDTPQVIDALAMMNSGVPHFPLLRRELAGPGYRADLRFAEDVVFNMEAIARAGGMTLLPQCLTHYIQRPDSASNHPDAWRRADAAYGQILELLQLDELTVPAGQHADIVAAIAAKRALNQAYGAAVAAGGGMSFQDFAAQRNRQPD
ncbi:MAG: glycosyltransferase [Alphaproteobacteria bacterium]|nr:glycosyltransferase [Alphaproteobacteria bacterium]